MEFQRVIAADISHMGAIAETQRIEYEGYSPGFWRKAPDASLGQEQYSQTLLMDSNVIVCVAQGHLVGCIIGALTTAPPVYNPAGPVCIVDDFAVAVPEEWRTSGPVLLAAVEREAQARRAVLVVVVCAQRDDAQHAFLRDAGLSVASEWYVRPLSEA